MMSLIISSDLLPGRHGLFSMYPYVAQPGFQLTILEVPGSLESVRHLKRSNSKVIPRIHIVCLFDTLDF